MGKLTHWKYSSFWYQLATKSQHQEIAVTHLMSSNWQRLETQWDLALQNNRPFFQQPGFERIIMCPENPFAGEFLSPAANGQQVNSIILEEAMAKSSVCA